VAEAAIVRDYQGFIESVGVTLNPFSRWHIVVITSVPVPIDVGHEVETERCLYSMGSISWLDYQKASEFADLIAFVTFELLDAFAQQRPDGGMGIGERGFSDGSRRI